MKAPNLTPAELERLAILSEEMGEAQQIIGKILRHGYDSRNPVIDDNRTNRELLEKELGDVRYAIQILTHSDDLDEDKIEAATLSKISRIKLYLHHIDNLGNPTI